MKEIEAKIIEVDPKAVVARLEELGAEWEFTLPFKAAYFDLPDMPLKSKGEVLRLRQEGEKVVLTYKYPLLEASEGIKVREEKEVTLDDHDTMWAILTGLGYRPGLIMNKIRTQYKLANAHVVLDRYEDEFAHIPPFLEIEAPSVAELKEVAEMLGYSSDDLKNWSAAELIAYYHQLS